MRGAGSMRAERTKYYKEHGDLEFKRSKDLPVLKVRYAGLHKAVELYKEALEQARGMSSDTSAYAAQNCGKDELVSNILSNRAAINLLLGGMQCMRKYC